MVSSPVNKLAHRYFYFDSQIGEECIFDQRKRVMYENYKRMYYFPCLEQKYSKEQILKYISMRFLMARPIMGWRSAAQ
jgi:hypothetical protein